MSLLSKLGNASKAIVDSRYRFMYRQRRIEDLAERQRRARDVAAARADHRLADDPLAGKLEADGIAPLPSLLSGEQIAEMRLYFTDRQATDPYRPTLGGFAAPSSVPDGTHVAFFPHATVAAVPHGLALANHPLVLSAVADYLGCKPTIAYMTAWWSMVADGTAQEAENFHRDYDDYKFVKLFVYLSDVDLQSGPHIFIRGSHVSEKLIERRRFDDDLVAANFPDQDDHLTLIGPAGTMFLETTFGLHRGFPPVAQNRLIFQVLYTLHPYYGGPAQPILTAGDISGIDGLDPYINRIYCRF
ncbi:phytanoyl-CoA dioxygenase family protein [Sphingopyxis granuli]|uniref:phytanoyl-CoA dioxygenase family protein n=1 Tax=Sphingopyxis granuli TaxID=267128 RepID=UPI001BB041B0|nr:phytanoyl-CoA dioxygenase family protein [Sphingopyxis granuli]QUM71325.1 phytanoyl-CoA dioxygenase family protein [Sphingopyxis granuli]